MPNIICPSLQLLPKYFFLSQFLSWMILSCLVSQSKLTSLSLSFQSKDHSSVWSKAYVSLVQFPGTRDCKYYHNPPSLHPLCYCFLFLSHYNQNLNWITSSFHWCKSMEVWVLLLLLLLLAVGIQSKWGLWLPSSFPFWIEFDIWYDGFTSRTMLSCLIILCWISFLQVFYYLVGLSLVKSIQFPLLKIFTNNFTSLK